MNADTLRNDDLHKEYPKQFEKHDFWSQIKRTVNGKPVSNRDIDLIVGQIDRQLDLQCNNHLLDLGCGNGALAGRLFEKIHKYTGVDFSKYLLEVAEAYFKPNDNITYIESDVRRLEKFMAVTKEVDKVLVYGCIAYLSKCETAVLLRDLRQNFPDVKRIFIGNVPNQDRAKEFFAARGIVDYELDNPESPIGVWWGTDEFVQLGNALGYHTKSLHMPKEFYGGQYRFDLLLTTR